MIIFANPGLIDLDAVRTMGVSVKLPNSFGQFGTGIKYGIATVLRGGGSVQLRRGGQVHKFTTRKRTIREQEFDIVCLDGKQMGFTTALGRNWEPWMVLREFGCNARDEGGDFWDAVSPPPSSEWDTIFEVEWDLMDAAYANRKDLFCEGEPLFATEDVQLLPGVSRYVFYRGVRALKLERPAAYTYNVLAEQWLSEDRMLYGDWTIKRLLADLLLQLHDRELLRPVLSASAGKNGFEADLSFEESTVQPTTEFLALSIQLREDDDDLHASARSLLLKRMRNEASDGSYGGGYRRYASDTVEAVVEALNELGLALDVNDQRIVLVPELPGGRRSMCEGGTIFMLDSMSHAPAPEVADQLLRRVVELRCPSGTMEEAMEVLVPLLLAKHEGLERAMKLLAEDKAAQEAEAAEASAPPMSVADALLVGMDVVGEEYPARPSELGGCQYTENNCPGHVANEVHGKVCRRCGTHIESLRAPDDDEVAPFG